MMLLYILLSLYISATTEIPSLMVPHKNLYAEGITYSDKTGAFYLNSIYHQKIISFDGSSVRDFIPSRFENYVSGVGILADDPREIIWAICSSQKDSISKLMGFAMYKKNCFTVINSKMSIPIF